jgi:hypothetical protein
VRLLEATSGSDYVLPGVVVFGLGLAITDAPLTAPAMNAAPRDQDAARADPPQAVYRADGAAFVKLSSRTCAAGSTGCRWPRSRESCSR